MNEEKTTLREEAEKISAKKSANTSVNIEALTKKEISNIIHELQIHQIELEMQNDELQKTQRALDIQKKCYSNLYDFAPVGYCTLDEDGIIIQTNLTLTNILEVSNDRLINQSITKFILNEDQDIYYLYHKKFIEVDEFPSCELRMLKPDGIYFWAHLSASTHKESGSKDEIYLIISDISEYKKLEERLKLKEEMVFSQSRQAAIGEMMSMIAHQWRQPLNNIALLNQNNYIQMKLGKLNEESFDKAHARIDENLQFMSKTIDDFRNFFRPDQIKEQTTIENVVESTLAMIGTSLKSNTIEIVRQSSSETKLMIHKNSLIHVLLNILSNAKDAFEANGIIKATVIINVYETLKEIQISICDNAGGIPEEILDQLSLPYFTTKGVAGTGLGLYISRTIIEKYFFGTLQWHNNTMDGACFVITLDTEKVK